MLNITMTTVGGLQDVVSLTETFHCHVAIEFVPEFNDNDIAMLLFDEATQVTWPITVHFERACTPENPVYLRYINHSAGYTYLMTEERKLCALSVEDVATYQPFIGDTTAARGTHKLLNFEPHESIEVGVAGLTYDEARLYSRMIFSPRIEYYDLAKTAWFEVVVDGNTSIALDTSGKLFELTFKLAMPRPNVQL